MRLNEIDKIMEELTERQRWNLIMKMVAEASENNPIIDDVGLKKQNGAIYHEFMIDGHSFMVLSTNI